MNVLRTTAYLMLADYLERIRRYSFLVTMVAAIYLGYLVNAGYITMHFGKFRCIENSAFIGTLAAESAGLFITLIGFYVVKFAINRDRHTRVGQILAATPIRKFPYLLGKTASNYAVLAAIVGIQAIAAVIMKLLSREGGGFDLFALLLPFFLIPLPAIAFTAAAAVLFESVRWLSGGFGNVFYFIAIMAMMTIGMEAKLPELDLWSLRDIDASVHAEAAKVLPDSQGGFSFNAGPKEDITQLRPIMWEGVRWTRGMILLRFAWFGYAFILVLIAVPFFDRFDETRTAKLKQRFRRTRSDTVTADEKKERKTARWLETLWGMIPPIQFSTRFGQLFLAEWKLMVKGIHPAWGLVALGFCIASLASPHEAVTMYIIPISWIWPVLLWSKMGMRETWHGTGQLVFSAPHIRTRQLLAVWLAGVAVAAMFQGGGMVNMLTNGDSHGLAGFLASVLFVPSLALAFGVWSGTSKLFEAVYTIWWYVGPLNRVADLDFTGMSSSPSTQLAYGGSSVLLLIVAFIGRKRQIVI